MPKPTEGHGQTSTLRARLMVDQQETIAALARSYAVTGDLATTAQAFGAGRRTLERLAVDFPALGAAIADVRNRKGVIP